MSTKVTKHDVYQALAKVAQALAHGNRLQLLEFMAQGERTVEALADMTGMSVANTSQHLKLLRLAGLVIPRKDGQHVHYRIADDDVVRLYNRLRGVAESRLAEVRDLVNDYLADRDSMEPVPADELLDRVKQGLVTVLDVRPPEEFAAGHLPGAVNIPVDKLESCLGKLSKRREVVAYCRGPYCLMSFDAVIKLRKLGWKARRLKDGFPEWKASGRPVDVIG